MDIESFRSYCLAKKAVSESFPFDESVLVFKVMGKMFALCNIDNYSSLALKCNPERAIELREEYPESITGAYHMNKTHWNSVATDGSVPLALCVELIDHSYDLIVASLPKKLRSQMDEMA